MSERYRDACVYLVALMLGGPVRGFRALWGVSGHMVTAQWHTFVLIQPDVILQVGWGGGLVCTQWSGPLWRDRGVLGQLKLGPQLYP